MSDNYSIPNPATADNLLKNRRLVYAKRVHPIVGQGNLRGFVDVVCPPFTIRGVRIIKQSGQRPWASLPQQQGRDGKWYPVVECADTELADAIKAEALSAWAQEVGAEL